MPDDNVFSAFKSTGNSSTWLRPTWRAGKTNITFDGKEKEYDLCTLEFSIPEDIGPPVLFYYQLTNFYQNHRRYVKSFSADQLKGDAVSGGTINGSDCDPLTYDPEGSGKPIYPCGLIANSMFNDTFSSPLLVNVPSVGKGDKLDNQTYPMNNNSGIAWSSDADLYGETKYKLDEIVPPPNWKERYPNNYTTNNPPPNLKEWEAFMVWMRTAGLPTFSKLYQRNDEKAMITGRYQVDIVNRKYNQNNVLNLSAPRLTNRCRFPLREVPWDQIHHPLNPHSHGWAKPVPGHCLYCRGWHLHPARCRVYSDTSPQA
jgi:hypothetical protein